MTEMTKRDIIKTLLAKELPDRVGLNEHFWPHIVENAWGEQGVEPETDFGKRFSLDVNSISWFNAPGPRPDLQTVVEETDEWIVKRDAWGASMKTWKHKAGTPEHDHSIPPSVKVSDYEYMLELFWDNCRY